MAFDWGWWMEGPIYSGVSDMSGFCEKHQTNYLASCYQCRSQAASLGVGGMMACSPILATESATESDKSTPASNPVQEHVDAVIGHLASGRTTEKQEGALHKALGDRSVVKAMSGRRVFGGVRTGLVDG